MSTYAFIFARGGSKGVKRKNIRNFCGMPLIGHSILLAKQHPLIDQVIVSTEDEEIAAVAKEYGAQVPFIRPIELAGDNSSEWKAWQHAITEVQKTDPFDTFVCLPATSPLRAAEDVTRCINLYRKSASDIVFTVKEAHRNPYFNMVSIDSSGFANLLMNADVNVEQRQNAPAVYDMATVAYVTSPHFVLNHNGVFSGNCQAVMIPTDRACDIDTELEFEIAEFLFKKRQAELKNDKTIA